MLEYNGIKMELINIDRFERTVASSSDGVDHLWNEYLIQVTAVVHEAYLNLGNGPFESWAILKHKLMEKRKKFKLSFLTGGAANQSNKVGIAPAFAEVGADKPFIFDGPAASDLGQFDLVPDRIQSMTDDEAGEIEVMIESPLPGYSIDAHNGPDPVFCHPYKFLGTNGMVITWAVKTWLVECPIEQALRTPGQGRSQTPLVDNRFDQIHDVDDQHVTTIATYGTAVFRTDLLYANGVVPDNFRGAIIAPIFRGFRRSHIQVKQMSDTTVRYLTIDRQTPVVFDPSVPNAVMADVIHHRLLYQQDDMLHSAMEAADRYYSFRANRAWAEQDKKEAKDRADDLHEAKMNLLGSKQEAYSAKADFYRNRGRKR